MICFLSSTCIFSLTWIFTHHSTELAAVKLVDYINKQMDNDKISRNIYLDLLKTFDTLVLKILLKKMNIME